MRHLERTHTIYFEVPVARAFPLFTPLGEALWIDGWHPQFLHPADGTTCENMVFRTGTGDQETLWTCSEWNPSYLVRYVRVTPSARFGFVEVRGHALSPHRSQFQITNRYVALNEAGQAELASLTEPAFARMIDGWQTLIGTWLRDNPETPVPH